MVSSLILVPTPIYYVEFVPCELVNTFLEILGDFLGRPHLLRPCRLGSGIDLLERSVKDEVGRLRARLVWYKVYCVQCLGDS